jgi:hypothetical protein
VEPKENQRKNNNVVDFLDYLERKYKTLYEEYQDIINENPEYGEPLLFASNDNFKEGTPEFIDDICYDVFFEMDIPLDD